MGTLERGLLSLWVGNCVVVGPKASPDHFDVSLPRSLWFIVSRYNLPPCILSLPSFVSVSRCRPELSVPPSTHFNLLVSHCAERLLNVASQL